MIMMALLVMISLMFMPLSKLGIKSNLMLNQTLSSAQSLVFSLTVSLFVSVLTP